MKGGQIKSLVDTGLSQLAASRDASPHGIDQRRGVELSFKAESMNSVIFIFVQAMYDLSVRDVNAT